VCREKVGGAKDPMHSIFTEKGGHGVKKSGGKSRSKNSRPPESCQGG